MRCKFKQDLSKKVVSGLAGLTPGRLITHYIFPLNCIDKSHKYHALYFCLELQSESAPEKKGPHLFLFPILVGTTTLLLIPQTLTMSSYPHYTTNCIQ
jgi:hypothetical protein